MSKQQYDMVIIGAGAGGLIAAGFAVKLGARVALVEKDRIGGDCTWIGCVPSKALLKVAKIAHHVRTASQYGIMSQAPVTDMAKVHEYLDAAIQHIYKPTTPEALRQKGMDVYLGPARFADKESIIVGDQTLRSKHFLITTGARPYIPPISGLDSVPYLTYERIFDNKRLPRSMIVVGGGPIGAEISQAYQRLGCQVTVVADRLLPKEGPDVRQLMQEVFEREGVRFVWGRATSARKEGETTVVSTGAEEARGEMLLVASGRRPNLAGLDLEKAGVHYYGKGHQDRRSATDHGQAHLCGGRCRWRLPILPFCGMAGVSSCPQRPFAGKQFWTDRPRSSDYLYRSRGCAGRPDGGAGSIRIWSRDKGLPVGFEPSGSSRL